MRSTPKADPKPIGRLPQDARTISQLGTKCGWLYKRSDFTKKWNSRFCVLKSASFLYYYESEDDQTPKGIIDLQNYATVETCPQEKKPFCFKIAGESKLRPFLFEPRQEPAAEADEWMKALHRARYENTVPATKAPFSFNRSGEAMENMGTLGSSLNEERRTMFTVRKDVTAMEKLLRAVPDEGFRYERETSEGEDLSASKATRKDEKNDENVSKMVTRVHEMLQDHIIRSHQEQKRTTEALSKERERVDKATGGGWELLQKAQDSKLKVETQLAEERELRHNETLAHMQVPTRPIHNATLTTRDLYTHTRRLYTRRVRRS
jgi:hypothetical protein